MKSIIQTLFFVAFIIASAGINAQKRNNYAFEEFGKWGYCYQGKLFVLPQYEAVASFGNTICCFGAQYNGKWGIVDAKNRQLVPFEYEDINLQSRPSDKNLIVLDSIFVYGKGTILPRESYEMNPNYILDTSYGYNLFPLLPVQKDGKWGYIDFRGNVVIDFQFDKAYTFKIWSNSKKKLWMAHVCIKDKWGNIDICGKFLVPCSYPDITGYKQLKKIIKKNKTDYNKDIQALCNLVPATLAKDEPYQHTFNGKIQIKKITQKGKRSATYQIINQKQEKIVDTEFDKVLEREGDAIRVMKDGKWGVVNLNSGLLYPCIYESISPFDANGYANATYYGNHKQLSLYYTCSNYYTDLDSIYFKAKSFPRTEEGIQQAAPYYDQLTNILRAIDNPTIRVVYNNDLKNFYYEKRKIDDPELRARIAAQKQKEAESNTSFWSVLGGITEIAGGIAQATSTIKTGQSSETGEALESLGKTLTSIDHPSEARSTTSNSTESSSDAETIDGENDIIVLQNRIASIDNRIQAIGEEQAALLQERQQNKVQMRASAANAVQVQSGSNLVRNTSPSRIRSKANAGANAQRTYRNNNSSIDTQIQRLNEIKSELLAERQQISKQIATIQHLSDDKDRTTNKNTTKDKTQGSTFAKNNYRSYQNRLNSIDRQLSDRKADPEKYYNSGESTTEFRKKVKDLQQQALQLIEEYKTKSGGDAISGTPSLYNWVP